MSATAWRQVFHIVHLLASVANTEQYGCGRHMVPAGRCHGAHSASVHECFTPTLPRMPDFLERWSAVPSTIARFGSMWLLFVGVSKICCLQRSPKTLAHLKNNIRQAVADIPVDTLERMEWNFQERLTQCIDNNGRHLPDIVFKTV